VNVWSLGSSGVCRDDPPAAFGSLSAVLGAARRGVEPSPAGESIEVGAEGRAVVGWEGSGKHRAGAGAAVELGNEMDKASSFAEGDKPKRAAAAAVVRTAAADMCLEDNETEVGLGVERRQEHSNRA
jgi:hypothetical protein